MDPKQLSHELREGRSPDLTRRRWIIGLSALGALAGQIVALFQTGILRRLPDPPLEIFDSTKVDASEYAYKRLQTPDALMMTTDYAVTAWLAGAGGIDRARDIPALPIALAAKTLFGFAQTVRLEREEWQTNKALCSYCTTAMIASGIMAVLALPEAIKAIRGIRERSRDKEASVPVIEERTWLPAPTLAPRRLRTI